MWVPQAAQRARKVELLTLAVIPELGNLNRWLKANTSRFELMIIGSIQRFDPQSGKMVIEKLSGDQQENL